MFYWLHKDWEDRECVWEGLKVEWDTLIIREKKWSEKERKCGGNKFFHHCGFVSLKIEIKKRNSVESCGEGRRRKIIYKIITQILTFQRILFDQKYF
jgi:hypothetical protein